MTSVLITGGAGFIGHRLAESLSADGHRVRVLDNLSPQVHGRSETPAGKFDSLRAVADVVWGDVTERADLEPALVGIDTVVHLAAETGTGQSMYEIDRYTRVNAGGTALLLDLIVNRYPNVRKVVVASSRSIYGEGQYRSPSRGVVCPPSRPAEQMLNGDFDVRLPDSDEPLQLMATSENSSLHPSSIYGITKLTQEQLVMTTCKAHGLAGVALRYQNVYGPGQSLTNPYTGILSIFMSLIRAGQEINVFEDGQESRDFVFIDDVVRATHSAILDSRADGQVLNVGSGKPTTVLEVVEALFDATGQEVPTRISGNFREGDIRHNYADLTRIMEVLEFRPVVGFAEGISRFVEWSAGQDVAASSYQSSLRELIDRNLFK